MPRGNYIIQRSCEECGKIFTPPTLVSKYCCPACSKRAYKKRQIAKEKEAIRQALIRRIPSSKGYLTVKEAMLIYGISKDVLYRMIRQGLIPSYNIVRSKAIIDEIDDYICPLYGLTQEETDFIKNYELEFRLAGE